MMMIYIYLFFIFYIYSLQKHAYLNILKKFSHKISDIFHISAQNIDWGYTLKPSR